MDDVFRIRYSLRAYEKKNEFKKNNTRGLHIVLLYNDQKT